MLRGEAHTMTEKLLRVRDPADVESAVQWALGEGRALEVLGQGSKRSIGRPPQTELKLDLSALCGVTLYEPAELVLSARGRHRALRDRGAPRRQGPAAGLRADGLRTAHGRPDRARHHRGTIAANLCGPRRLAAGAARDHLLGFVAVSGRGETFRSGGRVVKNVTGYDLCKLMAGSFGTLAVLTEVTVKTLPKPETEATVVMHGLDDAAASRAMAAAMGSACEVSGAAHLPAATAARFAMGEAVAAGRALTALRLEGVAPSVVQREAALRAVLRPLGRDRHHRRHGLPAALGGDSRRGRLRGEPHRSGAAAVAHLHGSHQGP